ncbi:hypothetical protein V5O39_08660 [Pseudomonas parakoreensis]
MQRRVFALHPVDNLRDTLPAGKLGHGAHRRRVVLQRRAQQIFHAALHLVELPAGIAYSCRCMSRTGKPSRRCWSID